jgi:hypothetical protein
LPPQFPGVSTFGFISLGLWVNDGLHSTQPSGVPRREEDASSSPQRIGHDNGIEGSRSRGGVEAAQWRPDSPAGKTTLNRAGVSSNGITHRAGILTYSGVL